TRGPSAYRAWCAACASSSAAGRVLWCSLDVSFRLGGAITCSDQECRIVKIQRCDLRVVQVEGGPFGPDPWQRDEVVPRGRATRGPLQRCCIAPRVVAGDLRCVPPRLVHVPQERQRGDGQQ